MREFKIGSRRIADDEPCYVIAELGHSHQGSVITARELIRQAKQAGADAVKTQVRNNKTLYSPERYNEPYNSENAFGPTYGAHREALELGFDEHLALKQYSDDLGIDYFATPFDKPSVDLLVAVGVPVLKIASFDVRSLDLLRYAAERAPVIVSTGGASWEDVMAAHATVLPVAFHAFLHCTTVYPAPAETLNLRAITTMRERMECVIGYSSHFSGISMPLVAATLGASILEVHFTLNRAMKGTDHAFSLEPDGLRRLVRDLKRMRAALGDGEKRLLPEELPALIKQERAPKG